VARKASDHTPKVVRFSSEPFIHPAAFINQLSYNQSARSPMLPPSSCLDLSRAIKQLFMFVAYRLLGERAHLLSAQSPSTYPFASIHPYPSPSAQIQALCAFKDIMLKSQIIMALKLKITIHYIIHMVSSVILIMPSLASSCPFSYCMRIYAIY
jgi:hypothetical protein